MTKRVRIENADTTPYKVVVEVWEKAYLDGSPDVKVDQYELNYPTSMTPENLYLTSSRYLIVKEAV